MFNFFNFFFPKKMVGIDIGTSSIKVVEISRYGEGKTLENYGQILSTTLYGQPLLQGQKDSYVLSDDFTVKIIRGILDESRIKTKSVVFSIPDFSTFCTSFDIPPMPEREIPEAIRYNASQYITLPSSEVTLDWKVIANEPGNKNSSFRVFLIVIPNQIIQQYQAIARNAGLQLYALEAEAMGIARAVVKNNKSLGADKKAVCIVDIGMKSSIINIVDRGFLKKSYSSNFNGSQLTRVISSSLGISLSAAEELKNKEGLMRQRQDILKSMYLLFDPLLVEIKSVVGEFLQGEQQQVDQVYITGGTANLPGLKEYFSESLKKKVIVPNCFSEFLYPPILDETLRVMAPSFSAAVGVALGGMEA